MTNGLTIIYEDDIILVCNKPAGLMVEPDRNNFPNLLNHVKHYLKEKTGIKQPYAQHLHRLDRPVSGIVLFTKHKEYLKNLSEQFAQRTVVKNYIALTLNAPIQKSGILEQWHRKEKKKATLVSEHTLFAEKIKLEYDIQPFENYYLWKIKLYTGKFHQIRVQLASVNCPILGDTLYGSTTTYFENTIALHAKQLIIKHPISHQTIIFDADCDFYNLSNS